MDMEQQRDQIINFLTECYAKDILDTDEYEKRVERVQAASAPAELEGIITDLQPGRETNPGFAQAYPNQLAQSRSHDLSEGRQSQRVLSILSNYTLSGDWLKKDTVLIQALLTSVRCDLRETRLFPVTRIQIYSLMAEIKLFVPDGIALDSSVAPVLAEIKRKDRSPQQMPGAPVIQIGGVVIMSELHIRK